MCDLVSPSKQLPVTTEGRAAWLREAGGLSAAFADGLLSDVVELPLAEALVLGLMKQGVIKYLAIFGHGNTAIAEILRIYEAHGLVKCWQFRNEVEMAHAATALSWVYGEVPAVLTSIGPGALQALAGSLAAASNGVGVYHLYGDETTHGEGYNMQQIPRPGQGLFGSLTERMGASYTLHTPAALRDALRNGSAAVFHPWRPAPFYLNLPLNTQLARVSLRLDALAARPVWPRLPIPDEASLAVAAKLIAGAERVAIKVGAGACHAAVAVRRLAEASGAVAVLSPGTVGVLPDAHPQNLHVAGSKGSISGNWAMREAELLVVIGSRAVCQSDCSGIGWPKVRHVVNINADPTDVQHYNESTALLGDAAAICERLAAALAGPLTPAKSAWLEQAARKKAEWAALRDARAGGPRCFDAVWRREVLTQPQAIAIAERFCREIGALKFFDAGDVQANGFQVIRDDSPGETYTESGASYMGFAVSALLSQAIARQGCYGIAFTGDGSFMMNPQILIDGIEHGVHGTILLFDNRRMAAISSLQEAQFDTDYRTNDSVAVDYVAMAGAVAGVMALSAGDTERGLRDALAKAHAHPGLSLIHVPVYYGADPAGGMGAYGRWNVGPWSDGVQDAYTKTRI
ncbi:thiamine pyrophosphate-dependent enzyme [Paraburkholderia atlantica]|uniref:thiamine pyrophosphate-dependent enzyme n=1 Tax=Paraburkholderia atlantica TaxID=2654982 RepID=UPI00161C82C3|nr:thiamine pyrophosphate-dependent enzyme [Paraburkholderia atlantica]MBB5507673.1 3D-(3,5/4)-trihydroxycyclohexane-1,2-dione acylhydrolase (decyclizing) [Paraburkholderia atlantica]